MQITIVGGGIAGLTAAIAAAEQGAQVVLYEAHHRLGGRVQTIDGPYVANDGLRFFYRDGEPWRWLTARDLLPPAAKPGRHAMTGMRYRYQGRSRAVPPRPLLNIVRHKGLQAPHDRDFASWATEHLGEETARVAAAFAGVLTYHGDPGSLSAAFTWERVLRPFRSMMSPAVRYMPGGWTSLIERMAARARELGVTIETGARITELPSGPVIVATSLPAARSLLGDSSLTWDTARSALLDIGVEKRRGDRFIIFDVDDGGLFERYSAPIPSLAPPGHSLVQLHAPLRPGESKADGIVRAEALLDLGMPGWQDRTTWRRESITNGRTGAVDPPGFTWRDRPTIDRGDGVHLAGDMVAAPGLLSEVAITSAVHAANQALQPRT